MKHIPINVNADISMQSVIKLVLNLYTPGQMIIKVERLNVYYQVQRLCLNSMNMTFIVIFGTQNFTFIFIYEREDNFLYGAC